MIVLDLPTKTIIARFKFHGNVKSIHLAKTDQGGIHVLSKVDDKTMGTHENYVHRITFDSVVYREIHEKEIKNAVTMCLDHVDRSSIYVAVNGGRTIVKYEISEEEEEGEKVQ